MQSSEEDLLLNMSSLWRKSKARSFKSFIFELQKWSFHHYFWWRQIVKRLCNIHKLEQNHEHLSLTNFRVAWLCYAQHEVLWLAAQSHVTSFNQSEGFISVYQLFMTSAPGPNPITKFYTGFELSDWLKVDTVSFELSRQYTCTCRKSLNLAWNK